jgi:polyhydroxyalkanoate synthesis regulator phasin
MCKQKISLVKSFIKIFRNNRNMNETQESKITNEMVKLGLKIEETGKQLDSLINQLSPVLFANPKEIPQSTATSSGNPCSQISPLLERISFLVEKVDELKEQVVFVQKYLDI